MNTHTATRARSVRISGIILVLALVLQAAAAASEQNVTAFDASASNNASASKPLSNGVEARLGDTVIQVVALRDDVLRVRESAKHELPEDASWAVPEQIRKQSVQVTSENSQETVGFRTQTLRVKIERITLRVSISDLDGNLLQEDPEGWPVDFHQNNGPG